jgi:hypothetical protein
VIRSIRYLIKGVPFAIIFACIEAAYPRIAIISLYDARYKSIGRYSDLNKMAYAIKHGYTFIAYHDVLDTKRFAPWSKLLALKQQLDAFDWLFWSDADSLIMNNTVKLESLIDESYDIIITKEAATGVLNTGSWLIKSSAWSKKFLTKMITTDQLDLTQGRYDQAAFAYFYLHDPSIQSHIKILPQRAMNSCLNQTGGKYQPGDFIIHFFNHFKEKEAYMKKYYTMTLKGKR